MSETALVTGATEGIGRATAFALGRAGYRVGVCARSVGPLDALLTELAAAGITAAGQPADVGDPVQVSRLVGMVSDRLGPVDVLVNNAGIAILKPFADLSLAEWDATMATNLRSLFLVTREVLPGMRQRKRGAVVNIASLAGKNGFAGGSAYAASKHATLGFSRSLMLEVRADHIRVIAICPGTVNTPLIRKQTMLDPDLGRVLDPDDVAQTVVAALALPQRALVSELEVRPTTP